jgi:outer membrane biosynthesis protein TonB
MENEIEIFEDVHFLPFGISRTITVLSYSLFVIPAIFILIGSLIAATSPASFFRWSGISTFLGALPVLLLSFFVKHVSLWALSFAPYSYRNDWSSELNDLILEKTSWIPMRIVDQLFSPVISVAAIVCAIGIVLFVISLMVRGRTKTTTVTKVQTPPPPAAQKVDTPKAEVPDKTEPVEADSEEAETVETEKPKPEPSDSEPETEPEEIGPEEVESEATEPESTKPKKSEKK